MNGLYLLHLKSVACNELKALPYKWEGVWQAAANCTGTRFAFVKVYNHLREQSQCRGFASNRSTFRYVILSRTPFGIVVRWLSDKYLGVGRRAE